MNSHSRGKSAMGGGSKSKSKSKSGSKKPHELHIRRGHSGGFIVKHSHKMDADTGEMPPEEEHVLPDLSSLQNHVADNMGDQGAAPAPEAAPAAGPVPAAAGPAPAPAPAPAPQGM